MRSETVPVSEPVYDYSDEVYDCSDGKKDLFIQTLTECILQTFFRVYESSGASEEGPIITVWKDGTVKNNMACSKFCSNFKIDRTCPVCQIFPRR